MHLMFRIWYHINQLLSVVYIHYCTINSILLCRGPKTYPEQEIGVAYQSSSAKRALFVGLREEALAALTNSSSLSPVLRWLTLARLRR